MTDEEFAALQARGDALHAMTCRNCGNRKFGHGDLLWPGLARNCFDYAPHGDAEAAAEFLRANPRKADAS
jgi:hypothetical protein